MSMQLRSKITVAMNIRIHHHSLLNAKRKMQLFSFRGYGRNDIKTTFRWTTGKAIQLRLHGIRFLSEHLDLLEHRATTSAGKPVSILLVKAEKQSRLSFLLGSLQLYCFSTCLDCFMIFAPTSHECVIVFIKCSFPISLCFILCLVLIFWSGSPF